MKNNRQRMILSVIKEKKIRTHEQLVEELARRGVSVTQATISRDVKELGIVKVADEEGAFYSVSADWDNPLQKFSADIISIAGAGNLVIIRTCPGIASAVAAAVDRELKDKILGSIAGDDTIFVAVPGDSAAEIESALKELFMK